MMDVLHRSLSGFLESRLFMVAFNSIIFVNPLALTPQLVTALTATTVAGISPVMWCIFAAVQVVMMLYGIKTKSGTMFLSMLLSVVQSLTIIGVVLVRS